MSDPYIPTTDFIDPTTGQPTDVARRYLERVGAAITPGASNEVLTSNATALVWKLLTNVNISAAAAIGWTKISTTGSSLADLATRSASDLTTGTLAVARLPTLTESLFMVGSGAIVAAVTTYVGTRGDSTTETDVRVVLPVACVLRSLYVASDGTPGAAQTFTYTVRVNAADTSLTCSIADAASTGNDTTHSYAASAGDTLAVKLVTSAGAATRKHAISLKVATV